MKNHTMEPFLTNPKYLKATLMEKGEMLKLFLEPRLGLKTSLNGVKQPKNNFESKTFRVEGNQFFKKKEYQKGLEMYNKSICYAESGSDHLGIAYANKSAIYRAMGLTQECLESIDLAKETNYPQDLMPKLLKREQVCFDYLKEKNVISTFPRKEFKLKYPPNESIPGIVNCVELNRSPKYGKGLYATKDIHAGDIVINEKACVSSLVRQEVYKKCANCFKENHLNLIPCEFCTKVMYCSPECKKMAWEEFHEFECGIANTKFQFDASSMISLRIVSIALKAFGYSVDAWIKYFESTDTKKIHNLKIDHHNLTMKKRYKAILGLCPKYVYDKDIFDAAIKAYCLRYLVLDDPNIKQYFKQDYQREFLYKMLFLNCCIKNIFSLKIPRMVTSSYFQALFDDTPETGIGFGLYSITGLVNHSCAHNIELIFDGQRVIGYATRKIKKGEQLFTAYGSSSFEVQVKNERQKFLKDNYGFVCDCEACINNYPDFSHKNKPNSYYAINTCDEDIKSRFEYLDRNGKEYATFDQMLKRKEILASLRFNLGA